VKHPSPTDALERRLRAAGAVLVAGCDEVGRGALAGPVCVGAVISGPHPAPAGLADSKLLTPTARDRLEPLIIHWATGYAIGQASAAEIDELGMSACLTRAARRALAQLPRTPDAVILDGPHDYIGVPYQVTAEIKADQTATAVAAASVLAKQHRDRLMRSLIAQYPKFDSWNSDVGYGSPAHLAAITEYGPTPEHRSSWAFLDPLPQWSHRRRSPARRPGDTRRPVAGRRSTASDARSDELTLL
jgi:ribonuclease HII